jgi:AraC family transcriptional regulator
VSDQHVLFVTFDGGTDTSILTGDGLGRCEQRDFPGATSFIPAGRLHRSVLVRGRLVCGYIAFADSFVEAACGRRVQNWATAFNSASPRLVRQVSTLSRVSECRRAIARATLDALAVSIVRSVATTFAGVTMRKDDAWLSPAAMTRVLELIEGKLHENPPLAELASAANLSISAFSRAFRGSLGETPGQYIQRRRMVRAREMLLDSQMSASHIARALGFADRAHFANSFRRAHGCSPGQFRDASNAPR